MCECGQPVWIADLCERCANLRYLVWRVARYVEQESLKERMRDSVTPPAAVNWHGIEEVPREVAAGFRG